jgi:hypothetical protein
VQAAASTLMSPWAKARSIRLRSERSMPAWWMPKPAGPHRAGSAGTEGRCRLLLTCSRQSLTTESPRQRDAPAVRPPESKSSAISLLRDFFMSF